MKKSVSPVVAIALVVVVVIVAVFLFARAARTKKTQFIPGVGIIDQKTGKPIAGGRAGRRGGGEETESGAQNPAGSRGR